MVPVHPTVEYILYTTCTLGLSGALFIITTYVSFSAIRERFGISLVFFLSIANLVNCIAFFPWDTTSSLCIAQAFVIHFCQVASFFWSSFIGFSVFAVIYLDKMFDSLDLHRYMRWFHIISWGVAFLLTFPPLVTKQYGHNDTSMEPWCYTPNGDDWSRVLVYAPCFITLVFNLVIFIVVRVRLSKWESPESKMLKTNITLYVASYVLSQAPALVNRVQNYIAPSHPLLSLIILQISLQPLQGFWNALIFVLTEPDCLELYTHLVRCGGEGCCCKGRKKHKSNMETAKLINYDYDYDIDYVVPKTEGNNNSNNSTNSYYASNGPPDE